MWYRGVGVQNDETNACFASSVVQCMRVLPSVVLALRESAVEFFPYLYCVRRIMKWTERGDRNHPECAEWEVAVHNVRTARNDLLHVLAADARSEAPRTSLHTHGGPRYRVGDQYDARDFFERVRTAPCPRPDRSTDRPHPLAAVFEVADLPCGDSATNAQALIFAEAAEELSSRQPCAAAPVPDPAHSALVLHIRRATPDAVSHTAVEANETVVRRGCTYRLYAIVEYTGTGRSGHYVAHVRPSFGAPGAPAGPWFTCDDDEVNANAADCAGRAAGCGAGFVRPGISRAAAAAATGCVMLWYELASALAGGSARGDAVHGVTMLGDATNPCDSCGAVGG